MNLPEPVAWADDKANAGHIGHVESAAVIAHWARGSVHDKSIAARLKHPLFTAEQMAAAVAQERAENLALRYMLAFRVAGTLLYTDDGELSDSTQHPSIDFKRDSVEAIREKLHQRMRANYLRTVDEDAIRATPTEGSK